MKGWWYYYSPPSAMVMVNTGFRRRRRGSVNGVAAARGHFVLEAIAKGCIVWIHSLFLMSLNSLPPFWLDTTYAERMDTLWIYFLLHLFYVGIGMWSPPPINSTLAHRRNNCVTKVEEPWQPAVGRRRFQIFMTCPYRQLLREPWRYLHQEIIDVMT